MALVEELASLVDDVLDRFPQLEQALRSALVSQEQKEQLLDRVFGNAASTEVLNFLKVLSRHGRLGLAAADRRGWSKKLDAERSGMTDVEVRVAAELDDALRNEIQIAAAQSSWAASRCST